MGPDRKDKLKSPDELKAGFQELDALLERSRRLAEELQALVEESKRLMAEQIVLREKRKKRL